MNKIKEFIAKHKIALMSTSALPLKSNVAFAVDEPVAVSAVTGAMGDAFGLVGTVVSQIAGQPILLFLLAVGFIPVGIRIFKQLKGAAR